MNKFPNPKLLLHPNIPKPLHGVNPRSILGDAWWDIVRQEAYKKYDYRCWACGVSKFDAKYYKWLEAHEVYDINYRTGKVKLMEIVALCHSCHNFIHDGRLRHLLNNNKITSEKYNSILKHGYSILKHARLDKRKYLDKLTASASAKWKDYYLLLDGKKYYSKFADIDEWYKYYNESKS